MKKFLNQSGINMVESMVAFGLIGIVAYAFMSQSQNMNQSAAQQKQGDFVEDMVMKNVSRLKSAKSETFPAYGQNRLREYQSNGEFLQETSVGSCNNLSVRAGNVAVCIKYMSVSPSEAEFSNTDVMKIPQLGQRLYKLDITGESNSGGRRVFRKLVIFKR